MVDLSPSQQQFPHSWTFDTNHITLRSGLEFDIKYHILRDFRTSTSFKEISSHHFKDLHKLKLLKDFDLNITSSPRGVIN